MLQRLDPAGRVRLPVGVTVGRVGFVAVYRQENAAQLLALIGQLPGDRVVRLWALDRVDERLRPWTIGTGPGGRLDLLNRLIGTIDPGDADFLVLSDDDIDVVVGDLTRLLVIGRVLGFDLFQPSHSRRSTAAYRLTRKRPLLIARGTTFVEQGPLVVMSSAAQQRLLPLPDDFGMGWGVEVRWRSFAEELRLGVVDGVAVRHHRHGEHLYDTDHEHERMQRELARAGLQDMSQLQTEVKRYGMRALRDVPPRSGLGIESRPT